MPSKYSKTITVQPNYRQRTYYSKIRKLTAKPGNYCDGLRSSSLPKYQKGTKRDKRRRKRKIERRAMSSTEKSSETLPKRVLEEAPLERPSKTTKLQKDHVSTETQESHTKPSENICEGALPYFIKLSYIFLAKDALITHLNEILIFYPTRFSSTVSSLTDRVLAQATTEMGTSASAHNFGRKIGIEDEDNYERRCKAVSYVSKLHRHRHHSRKIKSSWIGMPSSAQKGIYNPAVLCYRNSLLQALLHAPKVVNWLRSYHRSKICIRNGILCVACHLLAVFNSYWGSTPKDLLQATKELDRVFISTGWQDGRTGRQEDPEEQLVWLAKVLSQQLPTIQFDAFEAISRFILNSTTECSSCGYLSANKGEVEGTISIDLQPRIKNGTVADYVKPYFCHRVEGFKCDQCSSKSPKQRSREIYHQPETLVIQLKRFGWDGRKDCTPIPFSQILSLDRYRCESNTSSCDYELSAIICHSGGMNSGHYVCRARGPDGHWMKFDDLHVTGMTPEQAMHPGTRNGWTPYLLFYQRKVKSNIKSQANL
ncbi:hypothetical protein Golomagni_04042 [Golovinomyces magnicellulatus]|nr:hypothetical protein Golomagni_04042 [Golovinomyces magnicellulatus]